MSVEVIAIGGYQEVGKNMTAVRISEDVIIFDMGIHLDRKPRALTNWIWASAIPTTSCSTSRRKFLWKRSTRKVRALSSS